MRSAVPSQDANLRSRCRWRKSICKTAASVGLGLRKKGINNGIFIARTTCKTAAHTMAAHTWRLLTTLSRSYHPLVPGSTHLTIRPQHHRSCSRNRSWSPSNMRWTAHRRLSCTCTRMPKHQTLPQHLCRHQCRHQLANWVSQLQLR